MGVTITLTEAQAAGIAELIALAERGREDFTHQAEHGDYSPDDIAAADAQWEAAQATAAALATQQRPGVIHPVIAAVEEWITCAAGMDTDGIWCCFTCAEAETTAEIARAAGRGDIADMILKLHAEGDDDPDDAHYQGDRPASADKLPEISRN